MHRHWQVVSTLMWHLDDCLQRSCEVLFIPVSMAKLRNPDDGSPHYDALENLIMPGQARLAAYGALWSRAAQLWKCQTY